MSRIDDLIADHCACGVPFKTLGEILRIRNGKDHKALGDGDVPVYGSGGIMRYADTAAAEGPSVLIPRKGSLGNLFYVEGPFWVVDTIFRTEIFTDIIEPKFLYYQLLTMGLGDMNQAGGVPSQTQAVLNSLLIPIPPLEVQREIVQILDEFTQLKAALEAMLVAELKARRTQYSYHRGHALTFDESVEMKPLGDLAVNLDSRRRPVTRGVRTAGDIPYYGASGVVDYVSDYIFDGDFLLVSEDGANLLARSTPIAFSISGRSWVNNHAHVLQFESYIERRFVEIYLNSIDLTPFISGAAQPKLNQANLSKIPIPNPSFADQEETVLMLDNFDTLVNDLSIGLPAELAARRKQYEYYRDKLLTFEVLPA